MKLRYPIAVAVILAVAAACSSSDDATIPGPAVDAGNDSSTTKPPQTDDDDDVVGDDDDDDDDDDVTPPKDAGKDAKNEDDAGDDAGKDAAPPAPKKRVFVTKERFTANLGGRAGADAKCTVAATAANLGGGPWIAWVSTSDKNIGELIVDHSPWYLVDQSTLAFKDFASLKSAPMHRIDRNETGSSLVQGSSPLSNRVWTATSNDGLFVPGKSCDDWSQDTTGSANTGVYVEASGASNWTRYQPDQTDSCKNKWPIYCFEQ